MCFVPPHTECYDVFLHGVLQCVSYPHRVLQCVVPPPPHRVLQCVSYPPHRVLQCVHTPTQTVTMCFVPPTQSVTVNSVFCTPHRVLQCVSYPHTEFVFRTPPPPTQSVTVCFVPTQSVTVCFLPPHRVMTLALFFECAIFGMFVLAVGSGQVSLFIQSHSMNV